MNPKPFVALNHFTVPVAILSSFQGVAPTLSWQTAIARPLKFPNAWDGLHCRFGRSHTWVACGIAAAARSLIFNDFLFASAPFRRRAQSLFASPSRGDKILYWMV